MGLDFYTTKTLDEDAEDGTYEGAYARWSYGGFANFRAFIAAKAGIALADMEGYGRAGKPWDIRDPLSPLLNHSDCDGFLSSAECAQVAPKLREILDNTEWGELGGAYKTEGTVFLNMLEHCAKTGEYLVFC